MAASLIYDEENIPIHYGGVTVDEEKKNLKVIICRQPSNHEHGEISVSEIHDVKWDSISGGVNAPQGFWSLYGYINYDRAAELVACSGMHGGYGGPAKICICKSHNAAEHAEGYAYLEKLAGVKPKSLRSPISLTRPKGAPPCTKKILSVLQDTSLCNGTMSRKELRTIIKEAGYLSQTFRSAIYALKDGEDICEVKENILLNQPK